MWVSVLLRGFANDLAHACVVIIPSLGVPSVLDHSHVAHDALDARIVDGVDAVAQDSERNAEQDCRGEVHPEAALCVADGAGANARTIAYELLAATVLSNLAQLARNEPIGCQYVGGQRDLLAG